MSLPPVVELRIDGRITTASALSFTQPLRACLATGQPFRALFDRRSVSAPTSGGRAALTDLYTEWDRLAALVVAWADVYDVRRAASLERARQARLARGDRRPGPAYPHRVFDDLGAARAWLGTPAVLGRPRTAAAVGR